MEKPEVKYVIASMRTDSNQSENSYSVVATSTPPPSPDELLFAQWHAELISIITTEAIENPSQDFEDAWFTALCKMKAPRFRAGGIFGARKINSDDLKSCCRHVWNKTVDTSGKS